MRMRPSFFKVLAGHCLRTFILDKRSEPASMSHSAEGSGAAAPGINTDATVSEKDLPR